MQPLLRAPLRALRYIMIRYSHHPYGQERKAYAIMAAMETIAFEQIVVEVLESLPAPFGDYLANVEVLVARRPSRLQRKALGVKPWQTVYGMYDGVPLTDRTNDMLLTPDTIVIFQEPLERDFGTAAALREQVRRTVLHEIAHLFGMSDERLHELGAY